MAGTMKGLRLHCSGRMGWHHETYAGADLDMSLPTQQMLFLAGGLFRNPDWSGFNDIIFFEHDSRRYDILLSGKSY